jgi:LPXTG-motif cell wall-anchored protein
VKTSRLVLAPAVAVALTGLAGAPAYAATESSASVPQKSVCAQGEEQSSSDSESDSSVPDKSDPQATLAQAQVTRDDIANQKEGIGFSGTGFTPDEKATVTVVGTDGSKYEPKKKLTVDEKGKVSGTYFFSTTEGAKVPVGKYSLYLTDLKSEKKSSEVSFEVVSQKSDVDDPGTPGDNDDDKCDSATAPADNDDDKTESQSPSPSETGTEKPTDSGDKSDDDKSDDKSDDDKSDDKSDDKADEKTDDKSDDKSDEDKSDDKSDDKSGDKADDDKSDDKSDEKTDDKSDDKSDDDKSGDDKSKTPVKGINPGPAKEPTTKAPEDDDSNKSTDDEKDESDKAEDSNSDDTKKDEDSKDEKSEDNSTESTGPASPGSDEGESNKKATAAKQSLRIDPTEISSEDFLNDGIKLGVSGAQPGEKITITVEHAQGKVDRYTMTKEADSEGNATFGVQAKVKAVLGTYNVRAQAESFDEPQGGSFTVLTNGTDVDDGNGSGSNGAGNGSDNGSGNGSEASGSDLPRTGAEMTGLALGVGLLAVGAAAVIITRRRMNATDDPAEF